MDTKRHIAQLMAIIILSDLCACNSCKSLDGSTYSFSGGMANILPDKDSIKVNDTLWFNSSIPTRLQPVHDGQPLGNPLDFSGASNVVTDIHIISPMGVNTATGAIDSFIFLTPTKGNLQTNPLAPDGAKTVAYREDNGSYNLSFGLVAKKEVYIVLRSLTFFRQKEKARLLPLALQLQMLTSIFIISRIYIMGAHR